MQVYARHFRKSMKQESKILNLFAVVSLDGRIAMSISDPVHWSSREDKEILRQAIQDHDVFVMGRVTYQVCHEMLKGKKCVVITRQSSLSSVNLPDLILFNPSLSDFGAFLTQFSSAKVALFGGASIYKLALEMNLVSRIYLTLEPVIMGGGISLTGSDPPWESLDGWVMEDCRKLNSRGTLQLVYAKELTAEESI